MMVLIIMVMVMILMIRMMMTHHDCRRSDGMDWPVAEGDNDVDNVDNYYDGDDIDD